MNEPEQGNEQQANTPPPPVPAPDTQPPEGFEPQQELAPDQAPGIHERDSDLIEDAEAQEHRVSPDDGDAINGDDDADD